MELFWQTIADYNTMTWPVQALIVLAAVFAPVVAPYDPYLTDLTKVMQPPSAEHWFGTDNFGRDVYSRIIYGTRTTLQVVVLAASKATQRPRMTKSGTETRPIQCRPRTPMKVMAI